MQKIIFLMSFTFLVFNQKGFAQSNGITSEQRRSIDSILILLKNDSPDTTQLFHLNDITWQYYYAGRYDSMLFYSGSSLHLANSILKDTKHPRIKRTTRREMAGAYTNMGLAYEAQGIYPEALKSHFTALKILEAIGYKKGMAAAYNNIGNIYSDQENHEDALKNYTAALNIYKEKGSKSGMATSYNNIGIIYFAQENYTEALKNYLAALNIKLEKGSKQSIAYTYNNIGLVYLKQGNYTEALNNHLKCLKIEEEIGDKASMANTYNNLGDVYAVEKNYKMAETYFLKGKELAKDLGYIEILRDAYQGLTDLYEVKQEYKKAFENHRLYVLYRDSLDNQETREKTIQSQMNYDFEKKEAVSEAEHKKELDNQQALSEEKSRKQKMVILFVALGLGLVLVFAGFVFRSLRITRKQKNIIEKQKHEVELQKHLVEEHQKDIIDSITYAKRLQQAILPSEEEIKKYLPDSFILYQPKDIVAGDFYWLHVCPNEEIIFVAAADSTGHGVPGAMVSVVCSNALNRAVNEFNLKDTGKILDKTRDLVLETFAKSGEEIKDGMDISLLSINRSTNEINWSEANNQLWYIQNNVLNEIKPDKQPIGKTDNPKAFTTHTIKLNAGDTFYLMTDGYPDQFGGPKGKKYKYKQLQEDLTSSCNLSLAEQNENLSKTFHLWKGNLEQVDDVTIIGIRI